MPESNTTFPDVFWVCGAMHVPEATNACMDKLACAHRHLASRPFLFSHRSARVLPQVPWRDVQLPVQAAVEQAILSEATDVGGARGARDTHARTRARAHRLRPPCLE